MAAFDTEAFIIHGANRAVSRVSAENPLTAARRLLEQNEVHRAVSLILSFRPRVQSQEALELLQTLSDRAAATRLDLECVASLQSFIAAAQVQLEVRTHARTRTYSHAHTLTHSQHNRMRRSRCFNTLGSRGSRVVGFRTHIAHWIHMQLLLSDTYKYVH